MNQATPDISNLLSEQSLRRGITGFSKPRDSGQMISFLAGFPDPSHLPRSDMTEATRVALERDGEWALQYGASRGYERLVAELQVKLKRDQGIDATEEHILITTGAAQALYLIAETFCNPGDVVLSEEPTWMGAVRMFTNLGVEVVTIPIDNYGTDVDVMERQLQRLRAEGRQAKLFYTIPNFQNPTGATTSLVRRQRIVELAAEYNMPVIEDDAYSDLRYEGEKIPSLYTLDTAGLVAFVSTFSKIIAPGLRLGWIVAHPDMIPRYAAFKTEGGSSSFGGAAAAEFCASGTLVEHMQDLRKLYDRRRRTMLNMLQTMMPETVEWTSPEGGFFIWLTLPEGIESSELAIRALDQGVEILPGTSCHYYGDGENTVRLSFSFADERQIEEGVGILGQLITDMSNFDNSRI